MQAVRASDPTGAARGVRRRWWRVMLVLGLLLLAYAVALAWAAHRLETDVLQNFHPAPAVLRADHPGS